MACARKCLIIGGFLCKKIGFDYTVLNAMCFFVKLYKSEKRRKPAQVAQKNWGLHKEKNKEKRYNILIINTLVQLVQLVQAVGYIFQGFRINKIGCPPKTAPGPGYAACTAQKKGPKPLYKWYDGLPAVVIFDDFGSCGWCLVLATGQEGGEKGCILL